MWSVIKCPVVSYQETLVEKFHVIVYHLFFIKHKITQEKIPALLIGGFHIICTCLCHLHCPSETMCQNLWSECNTSNCKKVHKNCTSDKNQSKRALEDHIMTSVINSALQDQHIFWTQCAWHLNEQNSSAPHILLFSPNTWLGFYFKLLQKKNLNQK